MLNRTPCATYRLQFNAQFTLEQATAIIDYLHTLGITDCYASPLFEATPGSIHGYDATRFDRLNPEIGTDEAFGRFTDALRDRGMGLLLDVVPNHMAADPANPWWRGVLKHGRSSSFAAYFDINWDSPHPGLQNKILLPILGAPYAEVLEKAELQLVQENDQFWLKYYERRLPLSDQSLSVIQQMAAHASAPDAMLQEINGAPGQPASFDRLHQLLALQHYRLAYWRAASEELNYRRFFDVTSLVGLRMEDSEVFNAAHSLVFDWIQGGKVTGLRIDHPDGLLNPRQYCARLQERFRSLRPHQGKLFIVVEKILTEDEPLPPDWPVEGTTGYDFLNKLNGLFVQTGNETAVTRVYHEFTGRTDSFCDTELAAKKQILERSLAAEHTALSRGLKRLASENRYGQDFTFNALHRALGELIVSFSIYRTYAEPPDAAVPLSQQNYFQQAVERARSLASADTCALDYICRLFLSPTPGAVAEWLLKFQQLTGPLMAKGVEDTAFYRYNRFISLNEVGGIPARFGTTVEQFHAHNTHKARDWPHSLLATATHDTKRGEDLRARLNVLSEIPEEWSAAVRRFREMNRPSVPMAKEQLGPTPNDEYLFYQTLLGAWPEEAPDENFIARITAYMQKATREAKEQTSWTEPNESYERAVAEFIQRALASPDLVAEVKPLARKLAYFGVFNSLAQVLLKATSPGIPDFYQGTELWDLSLVDPDNRRPVDYRPRKQMLLQLQRDFENNPAALLDLLLADPRHPKIKLFTIWRTLSFRAQHPELFAHGDYIPGKISGARADHIIAFFRHYRGQWSLTVVPRFVCTLQAGQQRLPLGPMGWKDTCIQLPEAIASSGSLNVFSEEPVESNAGSFSVAELLSAFPVALVSSPSSA